MSADPTRNFSIRPTRPEDFDGIRRLSRLIYPGEPPWSERELSSHLEVFPEGQFVAVESATGLVVGMAASLVIRWRDYDVDANWREITGNELFTNHDLENGRTLYGAEVMVHPAMQGKKIGRLLYRARKDLCQRLGLLRILAGARLVGYHRMADRITPEAYVQRVVNGELFDKTLTFQLKRGFHVVTVVPDYLENDPLSLGYAAVIEWLNPLVAEPRHYECCDPRYLPAGEAVLRPGLIRDAFRRRRDERRAARLRANVVRDETHEDTGETK